MIKIKQKIIKAWNASFYYKGFNLDMNNDIPYECIPNALFKTYGTKKEKSYEYLHSVHKGGLDYVKSILNRYEPMNYTNPYDEMIKSSENMIQEYINQYEYNIDYDLYDDDYEFKFNSVDDIEDENIKNEINSLYKSIGNKEQKKMWDNKHKVYTKQGKRGYSSDDILFFCNELKIKCSGYDWKMQ